MQFYIRNSHQNELIRRSISWLFLSFRSENNSGPSKGGKKKELQVLVLQAFYNTKSASSPQPAGHGGAM